METIAELVKRRERLVKHLNNKCVSGPAEENRFVDIENLSWRIAHRRACDIGEVLSKAKLLADVSGGIYPHTIEGALLKSLIDDLENLSN